MTLRNSYIRLPLYNRCVRLKDLLPLIEAYPEGVLKQTDLNITVPNPVDPVPEPVDQEMWDAHAFCTMSRKLGIEVTDPQLLARDKEFLRRRGVNDVAGQKSIDWEGAEQQRLQNLLDAQVEEP